MANAADMLREIQESGEPHPGSIEVQLSRLNTQLTETRREIRRLQSKTPGVLTIAVGVALGLFVYSVVGVVCTIFAWSWIVYSVGRATQEAIERNAPPPIVTPERKPALTQ